MVRRISYNKNKEHRKTVLLILLCQIYKLDCNFDTERKKGIVIVITVVIIIVYPLIFCLNESCDFLIDVILEATADVYAEVDMSIVIVRVFWMVKVMMMGSVVMILEVGIAENATCDRI